MKDESGSYAVLTEQGSLASQMMAAEVLDVLSRFQDAQEKQAAQYQLAPMSNEGRLKKY